MRKLVLGLVLALVPAHGVEICWTALPASVCHPYWSTLTVISPREIVIASGFPGGRGDTALAISLATSGQVAWRTPLDALPTRASRHGDTVLVLTDRGPTGNGKGMVALSATDGRVLARCAIAAKCSSGSLWIGGPAGADSFVACFDEHHCTQDIPAPAHRFRTEGRRGH